MKVKSVEDYKKIKESLIVIDMVNGFVKEGVLAAPSIARVIPHQIKTIERFLNDSNKAVTFIRDSHCKGAVEFKTFPPHCLQGSKESELVDELKVYEDDALIYLKNSTNFVFAPGFIHDLDYMTNLEKVYLQGCLSEVCVKNGGITLRNFFDEHNMNVDVCFDEAGIDTYDAPGHNVDEINVRAFNDMEANGLIRVKKI